MVDSEGGDRASFNIFFFRWVDCHDMADKAVKAVADGSLQLIPDSHVVRSFCYFKNAYHHYKILWNRWLENCKDWCISRQLWWGHRIPAYLVSIEGEPQPNVTTLPYFCCRQDAN